MIYFISGDILESKAEAIVNPVNCEGIMGKGLALQIKLKYPQTFKDYVKSCKEKKLCIGQIHYYKENEKIIINFPTKDKWRNKSKITYITDALPKLIELIKQLQIKSIAIPPLGCGLGGLDWKEVKEVLVSYLEEIDSKIYIYEPIK